MYKCNKHTYVYIQDDFFKVLKLKLLKKHTDWNDLKFYLYAPKIMGILLAWLKEYVDVAVDEEKQRVMKTSDGAL